MGRLPHPDRGLLPALHDDHVDAATLKAELGGVGIRIERYAPLWGEHGPMLLAALRCAVRLYGDGGDRAGLADLLRALADRLYLLSAGPRLHGRDGHDRSTP